MANRISSINLTLSQVSEIPLTVPQGGTGATNAAQAMLNLGGQALRGGIPTSSNINNFGPTDAYNGIWGQSSISSTAADVANGYPVAERGVLEVFPYGRSNGTQRYTTDGGRIFIRWLNAAWNAASPSWSPWVEIGGLSSNVVLPASVTTLSDSTYFAQNQTYVLSGTRTDSPVGLTAGQNNAIIMSVRRAGGTIMGLHQMLFTAVGTFERYGAPNAATAWTSVTWYNGGDAYGWRLIGADALSNIGYGLSPANIKDPFDWQQADMVTGQKLLVTSSAWTNAPSGITYNTATNVDITCVINQANRLVLHLTSNAQSSGNRAEYLVTATGAKGSRTFTVVQNYNSDASTVIPIYNGGTGGKTLAEAQAALGINTSVASLNFLELTAYTNAATTGTWTPPGNRNMHVLTLTGATTIAAWPGVTGATKPKAFSAMIYLIQDATGGRTVTLDPSYKLLNSASITTTANAVTILQLTYCGVGNVVDVIVANRT